MDNNLISNGGFETGDLTGWKVQIFKGKINVVLYDRSHQVQVQPGLDNGVVLYTRFDVSAGNFTLALNATAPIAKYHEEPPEIETHPFIFWLLTGYAGDGSSVQIDVGSWWLKPTQQSHFYNGIMAANVVSAELQLSFPSDPLQVKGLLYVDDVSYTVNPPGQVQTRRWSQ